MKIVQHYYVDDILQRSIVRHNGEDYVRIARWVYASGVLKPLGEGVVPVWRKNPYMEGVPGGCSAIVTPTEAEELERCFVARLIRQCEENGSIKPSFRLLKAGEFIEAGDEFYNNGEWSPSISIGEKIFPHEVGIYRRAILSRNPDAAE